MKEQERLSVISVQVRASDLAMYVTEPVAMAHVIHVLALGSGPARSARVLVKVPVRAATERVKRGNIFTQNCILVGEYPC